MTLSSTAGTFVVEVSSSHIITGVPTVGEA